jgi:hypothetical protein
MTSHAHVRRERHMGPSMDGYSDATVLADQLARLAPLHHSLPAKSTHHVTAKCV